MVARLDSANTAPVASVSTLRSTTVLGDPRQDGVGRLEQVEIGRTLQGKVQGQLDEARAAARELNGEYLCFRLRGSRYI